MFKVSRSLFIAGVLIFTSGTSSANPLSRTLLCFKGMLHGAQSSQVACFKTYTGKHNSHQWMPADLAQLVRSVPQNELHQQLDQFVNYHGPISLLNLSSMEDSEVSSAMARYWDQRVFGVKSRILSSNDTTPFAKLRLRALEKAGNCFTASIEKEAARTHEEWSAICEKTDQKASFGTFFKGDMVAMSSAAQWEEDPTGKTVRWGSSYVEPTFTKAKIYKELCTLRKDWSMENGYSLAVFTIRADNKRSREINEANGAKIIGEKMMRFADESEALTFLYEKELREND